MKSLALIMSFTLNVICQDILTGNHQFCDINKSISCSEHQLLKQRLADMEEKVRKLANLETKVEAKDSRLSYLENKAEAKDSRLSDLENKVEAKDSRLSDLETKVEAKDSRLSDLENKVESKDSRLSDLENKVEAKDSRLSDLENKAESKDTRLSDLENKVAALETKGITTTSTFVGLYATKGSRSTVEKDRPLLFFYPWIDYGGHYNRSDGTYTVPVRGTYMFSSRMEIYNVNGPFEARIVYQGEGDSTYSTLGILRATARQGEYVSTSVLSLWGLHAGTKVWVQIIRPQPLNEKSNLLVVLLHGY